MNFPIRALFGARARAIAETIDRATAKPDGMTSKDELAAAFAQRDTLEVVSAAGRLSVDRSEVEEIARSQLFSRQPVELILEGTKTTSWEQLSARPHSYPFPLRGSASRPTTMTVTARHVAAGDVYEVAGPGFAHTLRRRYGQGDWVTYAFELGVDRLNPNEENDSYRFFNRYRLGKAWRVTLQVHQGVPVAFSRQYKWGEFRERSMVPERPADGSTYLPGKVFHETEEAFSGRVKTMESKGALPPSQSPSLPTGPVGSAWAQTLAHLRKIVGQVERGEASLSTAALGDDGIAWVFNRQFGNDRVTLGLSPEWIGTTRPELNLTMLRVFTRAKEKSFSFAGDSRDAITLSVPGLQRYVDLLPRSQEAALALRRMCKAFGADESAFVFHGTPLAQWLD